MYQKLLEDLKDDVKPLDNKFQHVSGDTVFTFAVNQGREQNESQNVNHFTFMREITKVIERNNIYCHKKIVESFCNGVVTYTFYLKNPLDEKRERLLRDYIRLFLIVPNTPLSELFFQGKIGGQELLWA